MTVDKLNEMTYIISSMRYPAEHKEETRERIIHAASRRFRRAGAGVGIGQLMKTLKMTHGGFYRHSRRKADQSERGLRGGLEEFRPRIILPSLKGRPANELRGTTETNPTNAHGAAAAVGCP